MLGRFIRPVRVRRSWTGGVTPTPNIRRVVRLCERDSGLERQGMADYTARVRRRKSCGLIPLCPVPVFGAKAGSADDAERQRQFEISGGRCGGPGKKTRSSGTAQTFTGQP